MNLVELKKLFYKIANKLRSFYWFIFRPKTEGVKCLIENNENYLLIRTSYSGNYWTLPGGGVSSLEKKEDAVRREIKEEVGININELKLLGSYTSSIEYKIDTIFCFYKAIQSSELNINYGEILEARWFYKDELPLNQSKALKESLAFFKNLPLI